MDLPSLKIGLAGYGVFGQFLRQSWNELEGVKVVSAATLHAAPEDLRVYEHWEGLVSDDEVDLVAIAVPPNLHAPVAEAMMQAGKHVLIEKPIATSLGDAKRLIDTRDRTGRVAGVDFMMKFTPIAETLSLWKQTKPFGSLRRVVIENHALDDRLSPDHWFWNLEQSGGILVEHAVHFFDLIRSWTDAQPTRVDGWSHRRNQNQEDRIYASVFYDDGLAATQYHSFTRPSFFERTTLRLWYDLAEIELYEWFPMRGKIYALVHSLNEPALSQLPHFRETKRRKVNDKAEEGELTSIAVGGEPYSVSHEVEGTFDVRLSKSKIYADAVRGLLNDLRRAIADPDHTVRASLEDGYEALRIALDATRKAHQQYGVGSQTGDLPGDESFP